MLVRVSRRWGWPISNRTKGRPSRLTNQARIMQNPGFERSSSRLKFAILDDYQEAAERMVDWSELPDGMELQVFTDHLADPSTLAERLKDFQIIMGMRERTPFPRSLLVQLPELRLLITTGDHNASFD